MDAGRSPGWILSNHAKDQRTDLLAHALSAAPLSGLGEPSPIQPKAGPMPTHNRSGCNHDERRFPSSPESSQHDPEQLVQRSEPMAGSFGVQSNQLLAEGQVFEDEILTRAESAQNPAEEMPERYDHGRNLTENRKSSLSPNL